MKYLFTGIVLLFCGCTSAKYYSIDLTKAQYIPKDLAFEYIKSLDRSWHPIMLRDFHLTYVQWDSNKRIPYQDLEIVLQSWRKLNFEIVYKIDLCLKGKSAAKAYNVATVTSIPESEFESVGRKTVDALLSLGAQKRGSKDTLEVEVGL